jgi:uncharacterized RDD family membrane protein YckC
MENRIGFGKRFGAMLLDVVLCSVAAFMLGSTIGAMLGVAAGGVMGATGDGASTDAAVAGAIGAAVGFIAAFALIGTIYFAVEGFTGYTLGKLMLGIRIANEDGTQAPLGTLLGRFAIKNINTVMSLAALLLGIKILGTLGNVAGLVVFVGYFLALGAKRQTLHDQIMHTAVYPKNLIRAAA